MSSVKLSNTSKCILQIGITSFVCFAGKANKTSPVSMSHPLVNSCMDVLRMEKLLIQGGKIISWLQMWSSVLA